MMKINEIWFKLVSFFSPIFSKVYSLVPEKYRGVLKDIFATIGIISTLYFIIFFSISKPKMIEESEKKVEVLENVIKVNNKEIKQLHKENDRIEDEVEDLEKNLTELQDKSEKYKKQYEKQVRAIDKLSDNELSKQFTDTFLDLY